MTESEIDSPRVPAVHRAFQVLDEISARGSATLSDLARALSLPKSSLLGICQALVHQRFLVSSSEGYRLGLAIVEVAAAKLSSPARLTRVGVAVQDLSNPFFLAEVEELQELSLGLGIHVDIQNAQQDARRQIEQILQLARSGSEAIILDAVNSSEVAQAVDTASQLGVAVVAINVGAEGVDASVMTDNVQAGAILARHLAQRLNGRGRIAILDGTFVTAVSDRIAGFLSALREFPEIEVVARERGDHSSGSAERIVKEMWQPSIPIDGFFAINDPMAIGAWKALQSLGISRPIVSVDGSRQAVELLHPRNGIIATAAQSPREMARLGLIAAGELHAGLRSRSSPTLLPTRLITSANSDQYVAWDTHE